MRRGTLYAYCLSVYVLLFDNFQNLHGASLDADAAGNALGGVGCVLCLDQNMEGADILALAAANTELLIDHVNTLGILGDGAVFANSGTLAALNANHGLGHTLEIHDLDAGLIGIEFLIESIGAGTDTFQTCHALGTLFHSQFFHGDSPLCHNLFILYMVFLHKSIEEIEICQKTTFSSITT